MKRLGKIHPYRGRDNDGGQCGLEIFDPPDGVPVIVCTQLPWDTNTGVTNMIEVLAAEIALEYMPERKRSRPAFRLIEHLYEWPTGDALFDLVTFGLAWPTGNKNSDRPNLGAPRWRKLNRQEVEALMGEPYVDCFRCFRQLPPPTATTLEAVRLLRTHFSWLAKCRGPLAAAISRTDLPVVDPLESAGQLYVTAFEQWLFFSEGEIGVKLLSDEEVASRGDVLDLTRQLFLSVRQIAEIFLTYLELVRDRRDFAAALVEYFAHPEKLTVEIIQSEAGRSKLRRQAWRHDTAPWEMVQQQLRYRPGEESYAQQA